MEWSTCLKFYRPASGFTYLFISSYIGTRHRIPSAWHQMNCDRTDHSIFQCPDEWRISAQFVLSCSCSESKVKDSLTFQSGETERLWCFHIFHVTPYNCKNLQKKSFSIAARHMKWDTTNLRGLPQKSFKARIKNEFLRIMYKENAFLQIQEIFYHNCC